MDVFPPSFTSLAEAVFPITPQSGCFFVMGFYNLITVFPVKSSCCKCTTKRARSLVVIILRLETKGSRLESDCFLCAEVSSLQQSPG